MTAVAISSAISVDGVLDEPAWDAAAPATDFVQKDPSEGQPSSERTEVRILYDRTMLYVGVICHDRSPDQLIVRDINRDFDNLEQDSFSVLIDTFGDRRSAFMLATTPRGGQLDSQILNENRDVNTNWDGLWYVQTRIHEDGWTAEFAVPLKTLRFTQEAQQTWGIQFMRRLRRRNETAFWSPVPRRYSNFQVSLSGTLVGLEELRPGKNLTVKPYVLGGVERFASRNLGVDGEFDAGGDAKYGVTPGMTLDLTVNTDFSQVEADTQQVNLTRFPLFFPEKREFFLENAGIFQLGETYRIGPPRTEEAILFFSRRIGLSPDREVVPILGGARLTGRMGSYYLGLMNIQTRSADEIPANNFTVARLRRDILDSADVGVMFVNRQSGGGDDNRSFGADANVVLFRDLRMNAVVAGTRTPGLEGRDGMQKFEATWQGNVVRMIGSYINIQENFNPEVGFVRRRGTILHGQINVRHRFSRGTPLGSFMRDVGPHLIWEGSELPNGEPDVKLFRPHFRAEFQDGGGFEGTYYRNFERVTEPFTISPGVMVPPGDYRFSDYQLWYFSNKSKALSFDVRYRNGDFYSGRKTTYKGLASVRLGYRFTMSLDYERNDVDLPEGTFLTDLAGLRVNYAFSPRMFLNAFVQYNSSTDKVSSNIRFRFIHRPLSDLFVVYNEQRDTVTGRDDRSLTVKYTHLFGL